MERRRPALLAVDNCQQSVLLHTRHQRQVSYILLRAGSYIYMVLLLYEPSNQLPGHRKVSYAVTSPWYNWVCAKVGFTYHCCISVSLVILALLQFRKFAGECIFKSYLYFTGYQVLSPTTIQKLTVASKNPAGFVIHPQHLLAATRSNGGEISIPNMYKVMCVITCAFCDFQHYFTVNLWEQLSLIWILLTW